MQNNRFQSLASRLSLWIVSLGALIFIAVLSTNYFLSRLLLEDYVEDIAQTTASSTVRKIETIFNTVAANADSLAAVIATSNVSEKQIHQTIKAFLNTNAAIYGMTVALEPNTLISSLGDFSPYYYKKNSRIAFADLADSSYQYKEWAWYAEPKKLNAPVWSEPYLDEGGGGVLMTTYSTPIYLGHNKSFAGIATADIRLSWLDDIVKEIKIGKSGYGFILSKADVVIAHPDKTIDLRALNENEVRPESWQKYIESKKQSSTVYLRAPCYQGDDFCWLAIETLGDTGWKVVIVLPEKELISEINSLTIKISIIAIIGLLILLFIIIVVTRRLTSPLEKLATATQDIGTGRLDIELPGTVHNDEIGALTEDFNTMRIALKNYIAEIQKTTAMQQKLESEIQIAKDIQMSMIPGAGNVSIKNETHQLFALLRPARTVGGDLYYYQQDEETLNFIIGDVSDKGIPAALFMAKTITLYTRALKDKLSPGETFTMMNDMLAKNNDACMFVTALCGNINLNDGAIIMANAGHMNPIVKNKNKTDEAEVDGEIALGLMESVNYSDKRFQLDKGSSLVMYTDGISEAHNKQGGQYTDEKLIDLISTFDETSVDMIGNGIIDSVDGFAADTEQFDDITLLIIHFT
jgi:sigma-B regulation protein RsbU (phosphoserine phosphatase)